MSETHASIIDMLVSRMETHPHEFIVKEHVFAAARDNILTTTQGTRWHFALAGIIEGSSMGVGGLYSEEERMRLKEALIKLIRGAIDAEAVKAVLGGYEMVHTPGQTFTAYEMRKRALELEHEIRGKGYERAFNDLRWQWATTTATYKK